MSSRHEDFVNHGPNGWHSAGRRHGDTGARIKAYLRSLTAEHWLLFCAGLVIGLIIG